MRRARLRSRGYGAAAKGAVRRASVNVREHWPSVSSEEGHLLPRALRRAYERIGRQAIYRSVGGCLGCLLGICTIAASVTSPKRGNGADFSAMESVCK